MNKEGSTIFTHQHISVNARSVHLVEAGNSEKQTVLFLHGYPENWKAFEPTMLLLRENYHLLAIDLPGVGQSEKIELNDKLSIASFINDFIELV